MNEWFKTALQLGTVAPLESTLEPQQPGPRLVLRSHDVKLLGHLELSQVNQQSPFW
jgi:hypothetical protein